MKVQLKVIGGSRQGQTIAISIPQFMIGRADDCHLKPRSELISRYHCAILTEEAYVSVRDLGSKNGVYVNGERIGVEQELKNGDKLAFGPLEFEVVIIPTIKGDMKPKVSSVSDVVSRTMAQGASATSATNSQTVSAAPAVEPAPVAAPATGATVAPAPTTEPEVAPVDAAALFTQPTINELNASGDSDDSDSLADWLLGDDDNASSETQTLRMEAVDLDLPYTPQEPEKKEEVEKKPGPSAPSSSDAAANMLKNFFKGGR